MQHSERRVAGVAAVLVGAGLLGAAVDAQARQPEPDAPAASRVIRDDVFRLGGGFAVRRGERVDGDVVVIGGPIMIAGQVNGDVVAIGGPLVLRGTVRGDAVAIGGPLRLGPQAAVRGDVAVIGGVLRRAPGAEVRGSVSHIDAGEMALSEMLAWRPDIWPFPSMRSRMARTWDVVGQVVRFLLLALLASVAFLAARGPAQRVAERALAEPLKAGVVGLLAQLLFFPLVLVTTVVLAISIIGIPLLLLVPFAIVAAVCAAIVGFTGVVTGVGHRVRSRMGALGPATYVSVWAGIALLLVPAILGETLEVAGGLFRAFGLLFVLTGFLIEYAAWTTGLGALILNNIPTPRPAAPQTAQPSAPEAPPAPAPDVPLPPAPPYT